MLNLHQFGDHVYEIRTSHGKHLGTAEARYRKKVVGTLDWDPESGEIGNVAVDEPHRREKVATALLKAAKGHAREHGLPPIEHNVIRTDAGEAWAKSTGDNLPWRMRAEDM
jgi:GNAT superfamily N-acetyltransferase